jgi:NADH-quinone oxidoreductase subunit K
MGLIDFAFAISLFTIGSLGVLYNRNAIPVMLMSLELMLLSSNVLIAFTAIALDNLSGLVFRLILLAVGAAETAIGLSLLISLYHNRSIDLPSARRITLRRDD